MKFVKRALFIFAEHLAFTFLTFVFVTPFFSWAVDPGRKRVVFSIIMGLLYMSALYSNSWRNAGKDYRSFKVKMRTNPDECGKFNIYAGFLYAVPYALFFVAFSAVAVRAGGLTLVIYKLLNLSLAGIVLDSANNVSIAGSAVVSIFSIAFSGAGYIVGKSGFSISEKIIPKLVYKKK